MTDLVKEGALKALGWVWDRFKGFFKWWALGLAALALLYSYIKLKL